MGPTNLLAVSVTKNVDDPEPGTQSQRVLQAVPVLDSRHDRHGGKQFNCCVFFLRFFLACVFFRACVASGLPARRQEKVVVVFRNVVGSNCCAC